MPCFWCLDDKGETTDDHVVPRSIGGTLQFSVPSCVACQTAISKIERDVSRKSILAIHAVSSAVRARHPNRPYSGVLGTPYVLAKHPQGGYGEAILWAGGNVKALPHVELKVVPGEPPEGRIRGASWEDSERLFSRFRSAINQSPDPDGLVCEIKLSLELEASVKSDPDFWPRIVLLPDEQLLIRARDAEEARRFIALMCYAATTLPPRSPETWTRSEMQAGIIHHIALTYEPKSVRRLAAKIARGMFRCVTGLSLHDEDDAALRSYITGRTDPAVEPVTEAHELKQVTTGTEFHRVVLSPPHDRKAVIVSLYGHSYRVQLGAGGVLSNPAVVLCATDGSGMRIAEADEARLICDEFRSLSWTRAAV